MSENEFRRDVVAWVRNAEEDRGIALSVDRFRFPNGVCFHCQQCIEKYLKAVLVAHDQVPERIHDLVVLGTEAADHCPEVVGLLGDLTFLNPFSVLVRYPDKETDLEEAEAAVEAMERARTPLRVVLGLEEAPKGSEPGAGGETGGDGEGNDITGRDDLAETE